VIGVRAGPLLIASAVGLAAPARPAAQARLDPAPIDSGTVVRLHFRGGGTRSGRLIAPFAADSTVFRYRVRRVVSEYRLDTPGVVETPASAVVQVDIARRTRSLEGAFVGGAVGLMFGILSFQMLEDGRPDSDTALLAGAAAITAASVVVGALVGSGMHAWRPAP